MEEIKNKTQAIWDIFSKLISSEEKNYLIAQFTILLWAIIWVVCAFYFLVFEKKSEEVISQIETINQSEVYLSWKWDYKWVNKQISYLKNYSQLEEQKAKEKQKDLYEKINSALPSKFDKIEVAKFFEELFLALSTPDSPVALNSVNIWWSSIEGIEVSWKSVNFSKYPVTLNYTTNWKKFKQILDLVQFSGIFNEEYYYKSKPLPLMTISSVDLSFSGEESLEATRSYSTQIFLYTYNDEQETNTNKN